MHFPRNMNVHANMNLPARMLLATFILLATCCLPSIAAAQAGQATARFEPSSAGVGDAVEYTVSMPAAPEQSRLAPPHVPGLHYMEFSSGMSSSFVKGVMTQEFNLGITVVADAKGTYTIPAWEIPTAGGKVTIPAATLKVVDNPASVKSRITAEVTIPDGREAHYVGETIEAMVTIFVPADAKLMPGGEWEAQFSLPEGLALRGRPADQRQAWTADLVERDDKRFHTLSLSTSLLATAPGRLRVSPTVAGVCIDADQRLSFSIKRPVPVRVVAAPAELVIKPLPEEGRPADFSGAIGTFKIRSYSTAPTATVGEPLQATVIVSGRGSHLENKAPVFADAPGLKSYPPTKAENDPTDATAAVWHYDFIPTDTSPTRLPAARYSYFDPQANAYRTIEADPIPVIVKGAPGAAPSPSTPPGGTSAAPSQPGDTPAAKAPEPPKPAASILRVPALEIGTLSPVHPTPLLHHPLFWIAQLLPASLVAALILRDRRKRRLEADPVLRRRLDRARTFRHLSRELEKAARADDAATFADRSRRLLQTAASGALDVQPGALTLAEIEYCLRTRGVGEDLIGETCAYLAPLDHALATGITPEVPDKAATAKRILALAQRLRDSIP